MKIVSGFVQSTRLYRILLLTLLLTFFSNSIYYGMGVLLFLMFSFVFNDWVDADKDKIGHPDRAIPTGKITRKQGLYFSICVLVLGILWSYFFVNEYFLGFLTIYSFSVLYSYFLNPNIPILGTPIWSLTIAILILQPFTQNPIIYIAVVCIKYAHETLLDYRDRESDKQFCKTPTLANMLGKKAPIVAVVPFLIGISLLIKELVL